MGAQGSECQFSGEMVPLHQTQEEQKEKKKGTGTETEVFFQLAQHKKLPEGKTMPDLAKCLMTTVINQT